MESSKSESLRGAWEERDTGELRRLLGRAVAASYNGIVITDPTLPDNPIIYANPAFERMTGYSRSEALGRNCRFLQNDDTDQPPLEDLRAAVNEGRECRVVLRNYKKSGEMFWNELYVSPVHDEQCALTNFIGVQHDVTGRARAEEMRGEQEARWRALTENSPSFVALLGPDGDANYYNLGWREYLGVTEDPGGWSWTEYVHPDDLPLVMDGWGRAMESSELYTAAFRVRRHDGEYRWFTSRVSPARDDAGEVNSWIWVSTDIEDHKRVEAALGESEERLRLAFKATGLGAWDFDPVSGELDWDERTKAVFGLSPGAEIGYASAFLAGLHPEDRERVEGAVWRALDPEGGGEFESEYRAVGLEDGVERWVYAVGRAFFEEAEGGRRPRRFIGTVLDVTGQKKAEEERDRLLAREQLAREEAVAARRRLSFLVEADAVLLSSVGYFERLRDTARLAVPVLADWCLVDVVGEDGSVAQVAAAHADPEKQALLDRLHRDFGEGSSGIAARVLRTGKPEIIKRAPESLVSEVSSNEESEGILFSLGISSLMSVPLLARGRTLGVVTLVSSDPERLYGEEDRSLAESLAYRCALAVDNARLYNERGRIARTLQRGLLPRLPEVEEVEVGVEYLPLGEENEVGGDFYDVIRTGPDRLVAVVGDVCGKGATAAAATALARYTIQAVVQLDDSPAGALSSLNDAMLRQMDDLKFSTVACARLQRASGYEFDLTMARAGHPAPLILRAGGEIEKICPSGRALGVFDDPCLSEQSVRLGPGDTAVFYTDGLTEARSPDGSFFGEERLLALLRSFSGLGAAEVSGGIKDAALDFSEGDPRDDLAVLVLKVPE